MKIRTFSSYQRSIFYSYANLSLGLGRWLSGTSRRTWVQILQHPHRNLDEAEHTDNLGAGRDLDSGVSLASCYSQKGKPRLSERPYLKKIKWRDREENSCYHTLKSTPRHMGGCTHTHVHIHTVLTKGKGTKGRCTYKWCTDITFVLRTSLPFPLILTNCSLYVITDVTHSSYIIIYIYMFHGHIYN